MSKVIIALPTNPHVVRLADRSCSVFLDPTTGQIFMDEGDGDDRINGAVLYPRRVPAFAVTDGGLRLHYAGRVFDLGHISDGLDAAGWVESANQLILAKAGPIPDLRDHSFTTPPWHDRKVAVIRLSAVGNGAGVDISTLQPMLSAVGDLTAQKWKLEQVTVVVEPDPWRP